MRRLALVIVLACALCGVAYAGEIHTTGAVAPQVPSSAVVEIILAISGIVS